MAKKVHTRTKRMHSIRSHSNGWKVLQALKKKQTPAVKVIEKFVLGQ